MQVCTYRPSSRQITVPAPHHSGRMPFSLSAARQRLELILRLACPAAHESLVKQSPTYLVTDILLIADSGSPHCSASETILCHSMHAQQFQRQKFLCCRLSCVECQDTNYRHFNKSLKGHYNRRQHLRPRHRRSMFGRRVFSLPDYLRDPSRSFGIHSFIPLHSLSRSENFSLVSRSYTGH